ncbi:hypothetical protein QTP88_007537 [Uroleucon formosanum]
MSIHRETGPAAADTLLRSTVRHNAAESAYGRIRRNRQSDSTTRRIVNADCNTKWYSSGIRQTIPVHNRQNARPTPPASNNRTFETLLRFYGSDEIMVKN